jgi:type IV pilus assembly protein PilE
MYKYRKIPGFSINELLVVLAIISVLMLIALPNLLPLITKAKSIEAQGQLKFAGDLQEQYYMINDTYTNDFGELGFDPPKSKAEGGTAKYSYSIIEVSNTGFKIQAKATVDFDKDGVFNLWEIDQTKKIKEIVKD